MNTGEEWNVWTSSMRATGATGYGSRPEAPTALGSYERRSTYRGTSRHEMDFANILRNASFALP